MCLMVRRALPCSVVYDFACLPVLPLFDGSDTSDEEGPDNTKNRLLELFTFPGCSPALQQYMREEEIWLSRIVVPLRA